MSCSVEPSGLVYAAQPKTTTAASTAVDTATSGQADGGDSGREMIRAQGRLALSSRDNDAMNRMW